MQETLRFVFVGRSFSPDKKTPNNKGALAPEEEILSPEDGGESHRLRRDKQIPRSTRNDNAGDSQLGRGQLWQDDLVEEPVCNFHVETLQPFVNLHHL